ncbi:hypothetical protein ACLMJK_004649 [Lecanora helva]
MAILANEGTRTLMDYNQTSQDPKIWDQVDAYSKSFYSTVLADLRQTAGPNILSSAALLQQYTQNLTMNPPAGNAKPGPGTSSYNSLKARTGPLSITPSTIYQQYTCEVYKRRSAGSLIIIVILSDLVFPQTLWKLCTLALRASSEQGNLLEA